MVVVGKALSALGRNGPLLLVVSLLAGAVSRPLSEISAHVIAVSAFLLTLGSFLSAYLSPPEGAVRHLGFLLILVFVGLLVPLAAYGAGHVFQLAPDMVLAVTLSFLAPPVGSAAAIAAILGLRPKLALVVSISLTLASPLLMPAAVGALGADIHVAFNGITLRLFGIVGAAALATAAVACWRDRLRPVLPDAGAAAGVSVVGLVIVGLAVTSGLSPANRGRRPRGVLGGSRAGPEPRGPRAGNDALPVEGHAGGADRRLPGRKSKRHAGLGRRGRRTSRGRQGSILSSASSRCSPCRS